MNKRGPRPVVFVCIGMSLEKPNEFVSRVIQAVNQEEAAKLFLEQTKTKAQTIHGPFRPKRAQVLENTRTLKFTDQFKKAIYSDWEVTAFLLKEPENHAYLVFGKRVDEKKLPAPKGTIIVPVSELRFKLDE
jgi:hypothetical protein